MLIKENERLSKLVDEKNKITEVEISDDES